MSREELVLSFAYRGWDTGCHWWFHTFQCSAVVAVGVVVRSTPGAVLVALCYTMLGNGSGPVCVNGPAMIKLCLVVK